MMQHCARRQNMSGRFAVGVRQDAAGSLAALDLTGGAANFALAAMTGATFQTVTMPNSHLEIPVWEDDAGPFDGKE